MKRTIALGIVALTITACSASATVPPPVEQPTPQVIEKIVEVPVTPESCRILIGALGESADTRNDILIALLDAYLDYPDENLGEFGARAEDILANMEPSDLPANFQSLMDDCLGPTSTGASS